MLVLGSKMIQNENSIPSKSIILGVFPWSIQGNLVVLNKDTK